MLVMNRIWMIVTSLRFSFCLHFLLRSPDWFSPKKFWDMIEPRYAREHVVT